MKQSILRSFQVICICEDCANSFLNFITAFAINLEESPGEYQNTWLVSHICLDMISKGSFI